MGSILRIVKNSRKPRFLEETKIGICHKFEGISRTEGCNCPTKDKPDPYLVTSFEIKWHT